MKKLLSMLLALTMALSLAACGNNAGGSTDTSEPPEASEPVETPDTSAPAESPDVSDPAETPESTEPAGEETPSEQEGSHILIAYFSRVGNTDFPDDTDTSSSASVMATEDSLQGNAEVLARMIQSAVGGDLFLIETEETYPVSYDETIDVGQQEQSDNARPALASQVENLDQYDTVFLGYPNWWGDMPMAVYSFLDEYDLSGKTIIPFVTHGGSGFSGTESAIAELEPSATVLDGLSVRDSGVADAQADVESWIAGLGLTD